MRCGTRVRAAEEADLDGVYAIELASFPEPYPPAYLRVLLSLCGDLFLVSEGEGGLDGYAIALQLRGGICHVLSIAVHPRCRGRGVGAALLQSLMEVCSERGSRIYILEVDVKNYAAQTLYARTGFRPVALIENYYGVGRHALVMVLVEELEVGFSN